MGFTCLAKHTPSLRHLPACAGPLRARERALLLEEAIHKMTGMPASRLALNSAAFLKSGYAADLWCSIRSLCATSPPSTIRFARRSSAVRLVNGIAVKDADKATCALPGQFCGGLNTLFSTVPQKYGSDSRGCPRSDGPIIYSLSPCGRGSR